MGITGFAGSATQTGPSGQALRSGFWHYLEIKAVCSSTGGQLVIRANGVTILNAANLNTNSAATGTFNNITINRQWHGYAQQYDGGTLASGTTLDIDDLYIADGQTGGAHDFIGNINVNALLPNGAGAVTQFSPTGAATDWQAVSENPPNDDTSYIGSATVGNQDLYTVPAPPVTAGPVAAVAVNMWARTD
ncbi:MAG TPA: hypothetical protein VK009_20590, partial [Chloroflexota bacterium]|nr:hypothetical protein [Chloroflexota bacterium]